MKKLHLLLITAILIIPAFSTHAQTVDILWQGDTYTPPFHFGKALWSKQSTIKLVAMPNGLGNSSSLNYRWVKNGTVLGTISGIGKNTITYTDSILSKPQNIRVDIMAGDGKTVRASASTTITPSSPTVIVYENNPLYGFMFHKETKGTYALKDREVTFAAFPFFFSTSNRFSSSLKYEWRNNAGGTEVQNAVTYRTPDNASGQAEVSVHISSPSKITQDVRSVFLIQFENNSIPNL